MSGKSGFSKKGAASLIGAKDLEIRKLTHLLAWTMQYAARQQQEIKRVHELALTDELTGLYNRRGFMTLAKQQFKLARRSGESILLIFVDVNGLKQTNDLYGHSEGDHALEETAGILMNSVRDSDIVARVGGDEFVILAHKASASDRLRITSRLERNVQTRNHSKAGRHSLTLSYGCSILSGRHASIHDLMTEADHDMYRRKHLASGAEESRRSA